MRQFAPGGGGAARRSACRSLRGGGDAFLPAALLGIALVAGHRGAGPITAAEQQVALLASAGRSNKEIAEELVLSLRTVENYLHRVYEKLGISGRSELSSA